MIEEIVIINGDTGVQQTLYKVHNNYYSTLAEANEYLARCSKGL